MVLRPSAYRPSSGHFVATFPQGKAFGMVLRLRAYRPSSGHFVATFPQGKASLKRTQFDANLLLP